MLFISFLLQMESCMLKSPQSSTEQAQMPENTEVHPKEALGRAWQHYQQAQSKVHMSTKLFSGGAACPSHIAFRRCTAVSFSLCSPPTLKKYIQYCQHLDCCLPGEGCLQRYDHIGLGLCSPTELQQSPPYKHVVWASQNHSASQVGRDPYVLLSDIPLPSLSEYHGLAPKPTHHFIFKQIFFFPAVRNTERIFF